MIQRFNHECETFAGKPMSPNSEGLWIGYDDYIKDKEALQQALAAAEGRVKFLERALRHIESRGCYPIGMDANLEESVSALKHIARVALRGEAPGEEGK